MTAPSRAAASASRASQIGRLASAAMLLSASFVLSRILGLLRNVVIADIFGNSRAVEAYFAAFRIPDTIFLLVSGGALASAFIPTFAGLLADDETSEAWRVASTVLTTLALSLAGLAVVAWVLAPPVMSVLVPGFTPGQRGLTVDLTRIMLLQPIFLGLSALVTAILQSYGRFALTAVAPLVYNLCVIAGGLLGATLGVRALAWSVVVGAVAQLVIQVPGLRYELRRYLRLQVDWRSPRAREVLRLFGPRVVGLAAFQAMLLITLVLASILPPGNVAAINYAWPLIMFPIGALGTAAATVIFPTLSRLSAAEDFSAVRRTVNRSLRLVLFLALPASVGLVVLRRPVINLLFHHGNWTHMATEQTAFALLFYALAIAPLSAIEVLPRVFYAMKDTVTPVRIAIVAVALDACLSIVFVLLLPRASGQGGLALATAIASTLQAVWLARELESQLGGIGRRGLLLTLRDTAIASLTMGMVLYLCLDPLTAVFAQRGWGALVTVGIEVILGLASFSAACYVLGSPELAEVRGFITRRR
ncbi:MAG: murein biosynthesis integral membrane protein MurJ [Chloroflexi bacterium]|nr:murein biosynthesis integral membrane protein MurJ [Chloroflexota bacterium]